MTEKRGAPIKGRRQAREAALQALYQMEISGNSKADASGDDEYSRALVEGVLAKRKELDSLIEESSEHWDLSRMSVVDKCVLRMAAFELTCRKDVPYKVVIDEAVSLAGKYGGDESGAFVNGILDRIAKLKRCK